jgi:hypothetical protein
VAFTSFAARGIGLTNGNAGVGVSIDVKVINNDTVTKVGA